MSHIEDKHLLQKFKRKKKKSTQNENHTIKFVKKFLSLAGEIKSVTNLNSFQLQELLKTSNIT